jgi:single-stranded DNA-binding protein
MVTFRVAVNKKWTDNKKVEHKRVQDWFKVEVWGTTDKVRWITEKGTPVMGGMTTRTMPNEDAV